MRIPLLGLLAAAIWLATIPSASRPAETPEEKTTAFTNATIYTATSDHPIEHGRLIISAGKIAAVGGKDTPIPEGANVINMQGTIIIPGLVDTHSHIGLYSKPRVPANSDGNEMSAPVQAGVRAIDAIDPNDPGIRMAVAGGITTVNIMPGSGNVIGGSTLYVKLRGSSVEDMRILGKRADGVEVLGGLKMANGENPKGYGKNWKEAPFTRMKIAALQREQFVKAREYQKKRAADPKTDRDISMEPLVEVLEKKRTVHFHCHRADDLLTAIRIAEEFDFELVLQHATEGYRIADILAKKKIPVSLTLIDSPGGKAETMGLLEENAAVLEKAGVAVTINTDDSVTESRFFLRTGAIAVRGGMSEAAALRALTITPAKLLHLDHRIGSLEKGKDADFVVLSGKPFSVYTKVKETWIEGAKRFDEKNELQRRYRDGGWALAELAPNIPRTMFGSNASLPVEPKLIKIDADDAKKSVIIAEFLDTGLNTYFFNAAVVIRDGKITELYLHPRQKFEIANGVTVHRARHVTPGLIDCFTTAGLSGAWNIPADQDQDEASDPNQADIRVLDGFNPQEPLLEFLRQNGVSVVHTTAGRHNVIAGTSGVFRTDGRTVDAALKPSFALLVNLGETAKGGKIQTRMGVAALLRKTFTEAQNYKAKPPMGARNPKLEALLPALEGKVPVIFAAHRADDIRTALRIADEFKLKPMIALGTEAWMLANELAKKKVPVIVHPTMQRAGDSMETVNTLLRNAALLRSAGVTVVFSSAFEGYVPKNRNVRAEAAMAAANGFHEFATIRSLTLDAAKLLGIDKDHGSIEVGKVADLVLYDGDPFEHTTHVTHTILNGKVVYDRAEHLKLPFERRILPLVNGGSGAGCCLGIW